MVPISSDVKALFDDEQRKVLRITGVDGSGNPIALDDSDVVEGSFSIDRYACNGEKLEIGTAISSELSIKLDNLDGRFDSVVFEGVELFVEIGIADWSEDDPEITWVPCGYFTPYDQPRRLSVITIKALDRMTRFDVVEAARVEPWTTNTGAEVQTSDTGEVIYFAYELALPTTIQQFVRQCANYANVPFTQDISSFPNASMTVSELPVLKQEITFRNLIQWCAGLMASNAWIDWNGELRFSWYDNNTGYVSTLSNRFSSDLYETPLVITGVRFQDTDDENTVYLAGSDDYALDVSNNCFITPENASTVLNAIYNKVHDFAYTPFTASVIAAPYLWPMDRMVFTDKDDNGHVSLLTNVNFNLNGTTEIKAIGESAERNSYASTGPFTTQQARVLENVAGVTSDDLDEAVQHATEMITGGLGGYVVLDVNEQTGQTEELLIMDTPDKTTAVNVWRFNQGGLGHSSNGYDGPFNDVALTSDGRINANMITTGTMSANHVRAGTITDDTGDNYWNLNTGEFRMTQGSIDIGNFAVSSTGKLVCAGAEINGEFSVEYIPVPAEEAPEIGQNTYKIALEGTGFNFYANDVLSGKIRENVWVEASSNVVHDDGVIFEDVRGNGISLASTHSTLELAGNNGSMTASGTITVNPYGQLTLKSSNDHVSIESDIHDVIITAGNDVSITSSGDTDITSVGDISLDSGQNGINLSGASLYVYDRRSYAYGTGITDSFWAWQWGSDWIHNLPLYLRFVNGICVDAHY